MWLSAYAVSYFAIPIWFLAGWGAYRELNRASRFRSVIAALLFVILSIPAFAALGVLANALIP